MMHIIVPWQPNDSKAKMVTSAALLLREHGVAGTSFAKVLDHSSTSRGSVGHHFPGGKREMIADAVRYAGDVASAAMRHAIDRGDPPAQVFAMVCGFYRRALLDTDFAAACPVGAVAQEAHHDPPLREATAAVFDDWHTILADALTAAGHPAQSADELATLAIASLEGALMIARVQRSPTPIDHVQHSVAALLNASR
jgi:AcrR family transcriptional regulator